MKRFALLTLISLTLPLGLAACSQPAASGGHEAHAGHDHADHADQAGHADRGDAVKMSHAAADIDPQGVPASFAAKPAVGTKAVCPVMEDPFVVAENTLVAEYEGRFYAFCCKECGPRFEAEPAKYVARAVELDRAHGVSAPAGG